jgi:O-antigen/teichoic acid export membrane protein
MDTALRGASAGLGAVYLFLAPHPDLFLASLLYCAPYFAMLIPVWFEVRGHRPRMPGPIRLILVLMGENLGTAVYLQGDVLLLGWLTNSATAGYYTITWILASAISLAGQSLVTTYHEPLREQDGLLSAGPPLRRTLIMSAAGGLVVLIVGIGLLVSPVPTELAVAMMIMAWYCFARSIIFVFRVVLSAQRRDMLRLTSSLGLVPVKFLILAALAGPLGAIGAAIATAITDSLQLVIFWVALYRRRSN